MSIKRVELSQKDLKALQDRIDNSLLSNHDKQLIKEIIESYEYFNTVLQEKDVSIHKLQKIIFGKKTESSKNILNRLEKQGKVKRKKKPKGHGRYSADAFKSAEKIKIIHSELKNGDPCPECQKGKVYRMKKPKVIIRIRSDAPFKSKVYELEKLRCNLCLAIFTAKLPDEAGNDKYDEKTKAMVPILRYGSGFPHNRIEDLQSSLGHPFPASNQWEIIKNLSENIQPAYDQMLFLAAQGEVIHNDDTNMKILAFMKFKKELYDKQKRTGVFTSGFLSIKDNHKIALFFTGKNHAGENMAQLLNLRSKNLSPPIQMCDALTRNIPKEYKVFLAHCLAHGRRNFTDLILLWPEKCEFAIKLIAKVYRNEALIKEQNMSDAKRLHYHKMHSAPVMRRLKKWFNNQLDDLKVEPNSSLGHAITYMLSHWKELTLFLRKEKAPIDNNICERALKKAILHRKNSLFFKTENGARIGDMFMSIIHTCNLSNINPLDYLVALQKNLQKLIKNPERWLPWNYADNIDSIAV